MATTVLHAVLDRLFPPRCVFCRKLLDRADAGICTSCRASLHRCTGTKVRGVTFTAACAVPFFYEGPVRSAILRFKFYGRKNYADCFGYLIAACVRERLRDPFDLITWVPVSPKRARRRGYDQAELLARAVSKSLGIPAIPTLRKTVHNPAQSGIRGAGARRANVKGVYNPTEPFTAADQRILLVDDIITTGATVSEAARTLMTAGAEKVYAAALARTK